jgi:hypothetical protein
MIKPESKSRRQTDKAGRWEMNSPYEETLIKLIVAMFNFSFSDFPEVLDGFEVTSVPDAKKQRLGDTLTAQLQIIYEGKRLKGEIYTVTNRKKTPITITESDFYSAGTRAIALRDHVLTGQMSTLLYVVMSVNP